MPVQVTLEGRPLAIYPVRGKVPCCEGGYKAAVAEPQQIHDLFLRYRNAQIAVATGAVNGLDVVDVDPRHGGDKWFEANRGRLPVTRTHQTRSGGYHLLFRHADGLRCSDGRIGPGVDVKADGGGVVWWPAQFYPVLCEGPVAKWPEWLLELARTKQHKHHVAALAFSNKGGDASLMACWPSSEVPKPLYNAVCKLMPKSRGIDRRRVIGLLRELVELREGRNDALFSKAVAFCKAGGPVSDGIITYEAAAELLFMAAQINGYVAKDGENEAIGTIRSGLGLQTISDASFLG
jgi:hypothetical protein